MVVSNIVYLYPYLGKSSNLTNIFQMGWNHQLVKVSNSVFKKRTTHSGDLRWMSIEDPKSNQYEIFPKKNYLCQSNISLHIHLGFLRLFCGISFQKVRQTLFFRFKFRRCTWLKSIHLSWVTQLMVGNIWIDVMHQWPHDPCTSPGIFWKKNTPCRELVQTKAGCLDVPLEVRINGLYPQGIPHL